MRARFNVNRILKPYQLAILTKFFKTDFGRSFFLTGGTALAACYLGHRESKDFDLFSLEKFDPEAMRRTVDEVAGMVGAKVSYKIQSQTYNEVYLTNKKAGWTQRIDLVQEQPVHFGKLAMIKSIVVDNLVNIGTNKILAIYGRFEPKDYIDLFFLIKKAGLRFERLFALARKKDAGLFEYYFANCLNPLEELTTLPRLKQPLPLKKLVEFYRDLQEKLLLKVKPVEWFYF